MQTGMQTFPQPVYAGIRTRIPVENCEFSTFSTSFSTRVFHSPQVLWIYTGDLHNPFRRGSSLFPLFRLPWFLPQIDLCAKIQGLTALVHNRGYGKLSFSGVSRRPSPLGRVAEQIEVGRGLYVPKRGTFRYLVPFSSVTADAVPPSPEGKALLRETIIYGLRQPK